MVMHNLNPGHTSKREQVLGLVRAKGILRPRELDGLAISREYLNKLHSAGRPELALVAACIACQKQSPPNSRSSLRLQNEFQKE